MDPAAAAKRAALVYPLLFFSELLAVACCMAFCWSCYWKLIELHQVSVIAVNEYSRYDIPIVTYVQWGYYVG